MRTILLILPQPCQCPIREVGPPMISACPNQFLLFMTLLQGYVNGRCDLADPCNRVQSIEEPDDSYDFVVIGGGSGGAVVAGRLSENPQWKVCETILEIKVIYFFIWYILYIINDIDQLLIRGLRPRLPFYVLGLKRTLHTSLSDAQCQCNDAQTTSIIIISL